MTTTRTTPRADDAQDADARADTGTSAATDAQDGPAVRVREAVLADAPRITEIVNLAYRTEGGWTTEAHLVRGLRIDLPEVQESIADDAHLVLVAERDGVVAGCCYTDRHGEAAELGLFAVDPQVQGGGLGSRLIEEQAARRAAEGLRLLDLRVLQGREDLLAFYVRHGFTPTGEIVPFAGQVEDLKIAGLQMYVMERPLAATDAS
jgi:ribosomal protein S18 acetylase RimI-like enzyme